MNREQYLEELSRLLSDISLSEKEEALQYYREYFEDANLQDEEVIRQLGSPVSVAESIREELADKELVVYKDPADRAEKEEYAGSESARMHQKKKSSGDNAALIVVLIVLAIIGSPILLLIGGVLVGILIAVLAIVLGLIISLVAGTIGLGLAAVGCLTVGIVKLFAAPLATLILVGVGMMLLGLFLLFLFLCVQIFGRALPALFRGIGRSLSRSFRKKEVI